MKQAAAGDLIQLAGFSQSTVSNTLTTSSEPKVIKCLEIDPPIISISINVNQGNQAGKEGDKLTKS